MDPFDRLPVEIINIIIEYTADWFALNSLLEVSPKVTAIFDYSDQEAIRFTESALANNSITRHRLHRLYRMSARLRDPSLTCDNLAEFISRDHAEPFHSPSEEASVSRTTLRNMVKTASTLQQWACACLTTFLGRTRAVTFRRWTRDTVKQRIAGTCIYQPRDAGSPSWVEEYRVYRALWNLQYYADILRAGRRMNWETVGASRNFALWGADVPEDFILEQEALSVAECIRDILFNDSKKTISASGDHLAILESVALVLDDSFPICLRPPTWAPPEQPDVSASDDVWKRGFLAVTYNPLNLFWGSLRDRNTYRKTYFQEVAITDFRAFRALGMAVWDLWRLYSLGLWSIRRLGNGPVTTPDGHEVPQGADPAMAGGESEYRWSVLIQQQNEKETETRCKDEEEKNYCA
ncbi:hypothetical protein PVAR5_7258 [Paecilomyces variotii No. 5]|uniref:F-box domain-containing protein n=1 Tax=Byssochlamys spectabilis (strain No. 5 / NBRC 109023) TaxID=1356009 RepID=V5G982_BYSSN|nr:hypothetical protein PVAR5_7258 [Paecilomyces variotii No. 5]